jgi:hypothetical protein
MPDVRETFTLEAAGALTTGVKDRYETAFSGDATSINGVVGTAPTGASLIVQVRLDTVVVGTLTFAIGATEAVFDINPDVTFASAQTFDLNVTQIGSTVAGSDLDVSVAYSPR